MSRILSQEEVDALLKGVQTGKISTESKKGTFEVRPYNFMDAPRTIRVSPDIDMVFQRFGSSFRNSLSTLFYKSIEIVARPPELIRFGELTKMVPVPASINIFRLNPLNGNGLFIMESVLVFALVELFFGSNRVKAQRAESRPFSQMEERVIRRVALLAMVDLAASWKDLLILNPEISGFETNINSTGIATTPEIVIKAEFQLNVDEFSGKIFVVIPFSLIEPIAENVIRTGPGKKDEKWIATLEEAVLDSEIELVVELARLEFSIGDLLSLKPGDVLKLGKGIDDELPVRIQGIKKFGGVLGSSRGSQAVRITARY